MWTLPFLLFACIAISSAQFAFRATANPQPVDTTTSLNSDQVTLLRQYVNQRFGLSSGTELPGCKSPHNTKGLCIPKLLRMGFHSCVGGCTGCINLEEPDNAGLAEIADFLNEVYLSDFQFNGDEFISVSSVMTRADFWAFSSNEAVIQAARKQGPAQPTLTFKWGRKDCSKTSFLRSDNHAFPAGDAGCRQAFSVFTEMGLDREQTVALIGGGHSMGETHPQNSGYSGTWAPAMDVFSNSLFTFLKDPDSIGYTHAQAAIVNGHRKWQFHGDTIDAILLDSDVCMYWDIGDVSNRQVGNIKESGVLSCSGSSSCRPHRVSGGTKTSDMASRNAVDKFAASNADFFDVFADAWSIMLANGNSKFGDNGLYVSDTLTNPCIIHELSTCCGEGCKPPSPNPSTPFPVPTSTGGAGGWSSTGRPSSTGSWSATSGTRTPAPQAGGWGSSSSSSTGSTGGCTNSPGPWFSGGKPVVCSDAPKFGWCGTIAPHCAQSCGRCTTAPVPVPVPRPVPNWGGNPSPSGGSCTDNPGNWQSGGRAIVCSDAPKWGWCGIINPACAQSCGRCTGSNPTPQPTSTGSCTDNPGNWQSGGRPIVCSDAPKWGWCNLIKPACAKSCNRCGNSGWGGVAGAEGNFTIPDLVKVPELVKMSQ